VTEHNRRQNLQDELTRAEQCLRAAEALLQLGLWSDSVSRSYYAAFHAIRALLFSRGLEPRSHRGAIHLLNTEFIRRGLLPSSHNLLLGGLQRARELADYDSGVTFSEAEAQSVLDQAKSLKDASHELLTREGWTS